MKILILIVAILLLATLAFPFEVYVDGVRMMDVKTVRIVTPDGHNLLFTAPIPIPISSSATPIPRARRWYGPGPAPPAPAPKR